MTPRQSAKRRARILLQAKRIEQMEPHIAVDINRALENAHRELLKDLARMKPSRHGHIRLAQIKRDLKRGMVAIKEVGRVTDDTLSANAKRLARKAIKDVEAYGNMLNQMFERNVDPINLHAAQIIARTERPIAHSIKSASGKLSKKLTNDITRELMTASIKSETFGEMRRRIEDEFGTRILQTKEAAERIVRTEMMGAYNVYHHESMLDLEKDDPGWVGRWDAGPDLRSCPVCKSLDGQIADVLDGKEFKAVWKSGKKTFRTTRVRPPAHPNCRCILTPWRPEWGGEDSKW